MPPIRPGDLLSHAEELAGRSAGRGRPKDIELRRAISAAYYAIFHHVVLAASDHQLPSCTEAEKGQLARQFDHKSVAQVCRWIAGQANPPARISSAVGVMKSCKPLEEVALAFYTLQDARHRADYDHTAAISRAEMLVLVEQAKDAIGKFEQLKGTPERELFLAHIAMKTTLR